MSQEQPQIVTLPVDTLNAITGYLGSRPYVEVAGLLSAIQTTMVIEEPEAEDD